jgi:hypothetical protein
MSRHLCRLFVVSIFIAGMLGLFGTPGAWAETYTSKGFSYPDTFDNNWLGTNNNDLEWMDAVYFAGKEFVISSVFSSDDSNYDKYLNFHEPSSGYHVKFDIGNNQDLGFEFKTAVMNNVLYVFYVTRDTGAKNYGYSTGTIYYRTVTMVYGANGTDWKLTMGGLKSIVLDRGQLRLYAATMMNGKMVIVFTSGGLNWYYVTSPDGLNFSPCTFLMTNSDSISGAGGAVFQVPDQVGGEKLMLAYCTKKKLKYFFFDGSSAYGLNTVDTTGLAPYSVRLLAGSASGYTSTKYSIQVWIASPHNQTDQTWSDIYHREYIPKGAVGNEGSWSSPWNLLSNSNDDRVACLNAYDSQPNWAVIPYFTAEDLNTRMTLRLWYSKGTSGTSKNHINYRRSVYTSDLLVYDPTLSSEVEPADQDLSTSTVLGVIEGTPPFPANSAPSTWKRTDNISTVEFEATDGNSTKTEWSVGGTITVSMGGTFKGIGAKSELTSGLHYTQKTSSASTATLNLTGVSFMDKPPGDEGWLLLLRPHIINSAYLLYSWQGTASGPLHYDGYVPPAGEADNDVMRLSIITYGNRSSLDLWPYNLQDPTSEWSYGPQLKGMGSRPLSTKLLPDADGNETWQNTLKSDPSYQVGYTLQNLPGHISTESHLNIVQTTTNASTLNTNASFTAGAEALGFGVSTTVDFSMAITTTTFMQLGLGFWYILPDCDGTAACCLERVDVTPYILVPKSDASGYNAPWISDDIRNYGKPKPWCLSYRASPGACKGGVGAIRLSVADVRASFYHYRTVPNRDTVSAKLTLAGLGPGFSLKELADQLMHVRLGNYITNTNSNYVRSRYLKGNYLILELQETEAPNSLITLQFLYEKKNSLLHIQLDAKRIDLTGLFHAYGLDNVAQPPTGDGGTVPFDVFLGSRYHAEGNLKAQCKVTGKNAVCTVRSAQ